jgi:predicted GTPase
MPGGRKKILICGAAGRDFHNFNVVYRDDPQSEVIAFTATQIPGIDSREYPAELAGSLYPKGIPIVAETELDALARREEVDEVVFAYSDIAQAAVMNIAFRSLAAGADFRLLGPRSTMLEARVPVLAVCAVRTGCGKSQVTRYLARQLGKRGVSTAVIRHPMPYGNLSRQAVQRFATLADLSAADCTLEEREEYEPHLENGSVVFAGADYEAILKAAEAEADLILWDGGNNDFCFYRPDFTIVLVDALRPDHLDSHYPGGAVLRTADLVVISKSQSASADQLKTAAAGLKTLLPGIPHILGASPVTLENPEALHGARVLIVEDGPTITHGGMPHGAGYRAIAALEDIKIVDPRDSATPELLAMFERYPHIGPVLPAMGYSKPALDELSTTINSADIDVVVAGTPIDLAKSLDLDVPVVRVRYDYADAGQPGLMAQLEEFLERRGF